MQPVHKPLVSAAASSLPAARPPPPSNPPPTRPALPLPPPPDQKSLAFIKKKKVSQHTGLAYIQKRPLPNGDSNIVQPPPVPAGTARQQLNDIYRGPGRRP
jgi:senataxin